MFQASIKGIAAAAALLGGAAALAQGAPRGGVHGAWQVDRNPEGQFYAYSRTGTPQIDALAVGCYGDGPSLVVLLRGYRGGDPAVRLATPSGSLELAMRRRGSGWISAEAGPAIPDLLATGPWVEVTVDGRAAGRISLDGARSALDDALYSCWSPEGMASAHKEAAPAAAAAPAPSGSDEAAVRALIAGIYNVYLPGHEDDPYPEVFSPEVLRLVDSAYGDEPMDGDPFCGCQDFDDVSWSIAAFALQGDRAEARIEFTSLGNTSLSDLLLVKTPAGWRVDDIVYGPPEFGSFRAMLKE